MSVFYQQFKIGVLGGGQLGRMMIQAGIDLNLDIHVMDGDPEAPCKDLAASFTVGQLTDYETVIEFGKDCDLITIEIENVNTDALKDLQNMGKTVYPQPHIIELIQDKVLQKKFYRAHGIPTAPFHEVASKSEISEYANNFPMVNKIAREGYDGRGVQVLKSADDLENAFDGGLLEDFIDFKKEISVITARNKQGESIAYAPVELVFHPEANLVEYLFSPADISDAVSKEAKKIALELIEKLDLVGLLAVEMFLTKDDRLLVNECAPRTHNSGHQTIEGNVTNQFEQHLRAILNLKLGSVEHIIPSVMINILGEEGHHGDARFLGIEDVLAVEGAHVHLYGKKITKPFRKMGHVTIVDHDVSRLKEKANFVKSTLKVIT